MWVSLLNLSSTNRRFTKSFPTNFPTVAWVAQPPASLAALCPLRDSLEQVGGTPSPPLPRVSGVTLSIWVLWVFCHHRSLPPQVIPWLRTLPFFHLGSPFALALSFRASVLEYFSLCSHRSHRTTTHSHYSHHTLFP